MKAAGLFNNVVNDLQDCTAVNRAGLYSGNALDLHLSDAEFEPRPGRWLSWTDAFYFLLFNPSSQIPGLYPD
jgi:hypothetical protein